MQVFFHSERCRVWGEKKTVEEKHEDDTCTFMKYHEETVGHSPYTHSYTTCGWGEFIPI